MDEEDPEIKKAVEDLRKLERKRELASVLVDRLRSAALNERRKPLRELAKRMHDLLCEYNHTDGCSWGYEGDYGEDAWAEPTHKRWLAHAENLVLHGARDQSPITLQEIGAVLDAVEKLKAAHPRGLWLVRRGLMP